MKLLIFSDTHLEHRFDEKKYVFLHRIIERADRVVINGDFWEGYIHSFNLFINSPWNKLFPLLKQKKTVYIYGNHDKKQMMDKRMQLFSDTQTNSYIFSTKTHTYICNHGDGFYSAIDENKFIQLILPWFVRASTKTQKLLLNSKGRRLLNATCKRLNNKIKRTMHKKLRKTEFFICGHTHWHAEVDIKNRFANCGTIQHGLGQYITINDSGDIKLHEERY